MSWWLEPIYSPLEVVIAILLAAVPMSRISEILLGVLEQKTGISFGKASENND